MNTHVLDVLSVAVVITLSCLWILRLFIQMRKNKSITVCSGCSSGGCSTKSFVKKVDKAKPPAY